MKRAGTSFLKNEKSWNLFFERNLGETKIDDKNRAYEFLMKFGLNRHYWNEYIFEGYVNHQDNMILLAGFPDIPLSRPHSKENSESF
jgi:hypothetical protein